LSIGDWRLLDSPRGIVDGWQFVPARVAPCLVSQAFRCGTVLAASIIARPGQPAEPQVGFTVTNGRLPGRRIPRSFRGHSVAIPWSFRGRSVVIPRPFRQIGLE